MATTLKMEETVKEREIARTIKESECYVGIESDSERAPERSSYTLPDGNAISLVRHRIVSPRLFSIQRT